MNKIKLKESDIRKQLQDYLRLKGWHVHYNLQGLGCYRGISDLTCIKAGRVVFLEVKTPKGKQSDAQVRFQKEIEAAGGEYLVAHDIDSLMRAGM